MWLRLNRKPKRVLCFEQINWVTNGLYHENTPHSSSKFESFSGSRLVSIASKYSSVILTLKVYFISPHKLLFGCIFGPRLHSLAICPVMRNIDDYAHDLVEKGFPEGFSLQKRMNFHKQLEHMYTKKFP